ncbi:hypothetical protein C8J56DRAFT_902652 [Mycena floridula]|nr:hypothetical protein C8J56DRAFT_902652 [Mycena floridula]
MGDINFQDINSKSPFKMGPQEKVIWSFRWRLHREREGQVRQQIEVGWDILKLNDKFAYQKTSSLYSRSPPVRGQSEMTCTVSNLSGDDPLSSLVVDDADYHAKIADSRSCRRILEAEKEDNEQDEWPQITLELTRRPCFGGRPLFGREIFNQVTTKSVEDALCLRQEMTRIKEITVRTGLKTMDICEEEYSLSPHDGEEVQYFMLLTWNQHRISILLVSLRIKALGSKGRRFTLPHLEVELSCIDITDENN